jgi:hypothetical protein
MSGCQHCTNGHMAISESLDRHMRCRKKESLYCEFFCALPMGDMTMVNIEYIFEEGFPVGAGWAMVS